MTKRMSDADAAEFYAQPANQRVAPGPAVRPPRPKSLDDSIPVRFPAATVKAVKKLAAADDVTVSEWIRRVVATEVKKRRTHMPENLEVADQLEHLARALRSSA